MDKSYSAMAAFPTFLERFQYLKIGGQPGVATFGFDRHLNQRFYQSRLWRDTRDQVIIRDLGCDLGVEGLTIRGTLMVHHINPLLPADFHRLSERLIEPENLVVVSVRTHNAIHFGDENNLPQPPVTRRPGDTKLW